MKANPLACVLLVLLAVAVQLPAQNANTDNVPRWEDTQPVSPSGTILEKAQAAYELDARTNHITLDKPLYNNAQWSEVRLRASALKGDGLAASLCSGSNALQALYWLSLAATNGWIPSQDRLARDFEYERPQNTNMGTSTIIQTWEEVINPELEEIEKLPKATRQATAQFWWSKAKAGLPKLKDDAARNDARATYALGLLHESGALVVGNAVLAAEMFHTAAKSGLAPAQDSWGSYCNRHLTNRVEAAGWYYRAATQGLMSAQSSLSFLHNKPSKRNFDPHFQPKACERVRWTFEVASQPIACFETYWACDELGDLYWNGLGVQSNAVEAMKWCRRAIDLGIVSGWVEYKLALRYYKGDGVAQDHAEAVKWFRKAAEQNNAEAQNCLGVCYNTGDGVVKDYAEAAKWYRKAAEQNDAEAQYNLGLCYQNGQGVEKNYVEAYNWETLAAANNNEHIAKDATKRRNWLESQMSPEQIAEAQRLPHDKEVQKMLAAELANRIAETPTPAKNSASDFLREAVELVDWGLVASCVTIAVLIAISVLLLFLVFRPVFRYVRRIKISVSKLIILVGAVAFILCGFFPPWLYISYQGHTRSADYSFILSPPPSVEGTYGTKLDISRLAVEWFCIAVATGTFWLLVSKPEKGKDSKE